MKKILLILLFSFFIKVQAQEIKSYTWDAVPSFQNIPQEYKKLPAIVLFDKRWVHTRINTNMYGFAKFKMEHFAVKINEASEISKYNKVTADDNTDIRDTKDFHARVIKPNGEVRVLSESQIVNSDIKNVKSTVFEGVEKGDILEYYFIVKENPTSNGIEIYQKDAPVLHAEFTLTDSGTAASRVFASSEFKDNHIKNKEFFTADNIAPLVNEKNSKKFKNLVKVLYLITGTPQAMRDKQWGIFFKEYIKFKPYAFSNSEVKKLLEKLDLKNKTTDEKLIILDDYIKSHYESYSQGESLRRDVKLLDGKGKLRHDDFMYLYKYSLETLKIPYEIIATEDRFMGELDDEMMTFYEFTDFNFYIRETNKYIFPNTGYSPYGNPSYEFQDTKAKGYDAKKKENTTIFIPVIASDFTKNETESIVTLNADLSKVTIEKKISNTGYTAELIRYAYNDVANNEEKKDLTDLVKSLAMDDVEVNLLEHTAENLEFKNNFTNTPFIINSKLESVESFTEKAGNLLMVNLGKVLGSQNNLYQENTRKTDVDLKYAREFHNKIIFNIPKGYQVDHYDDLVIDKTMKYDETKNCSFKSTVKIVDNQVIITIDEKYKAINYPKEVYQEYRKVFNASADFNKGSIVLKPIKKK
ncbi:DUF3857 domain-containing protein [Flavobacterium circumlabens]|uniref:DUF3857 domain-containing protein n=1 Tax=Flavobacterium circumlabens TaxID=2133765 RepID=A0A4Y7UIP8_9FLAO|nr:MULTISPECIES: DUF3857 domain-containing protein [Flavobacterium]QSB27336.1 DUF3857 domain-containing protein [Flavobacterium sp. CLA17]TCN61195.1 uncharacterized protein DUF3857 [Flavobacterium circumlabens]TEB46297.1 DUF3857 domain-containing protein [Flavobacterium circumlabens]